MVSSFGEKSRVDNGLLKMCLVGARLLLGDAPRDRRGHTACLWEAIPADKC